MAVNSKNMSFRRDRASELRQMADLLDKHLSGEVNTFCIHNAISSLQDCEFMPILKDGSTDENIWGYDIEDFEIPIETIKHIKPNDIKRGQAILNLRIRADISKWNTYNDPLVELGFNVTLKGIGDIVYYFGFHIDKNTAESYPDEPHPIYHLHYNLNPTNSKNPNLGSLFYIDTPRIMHKPLDFILGISFLTSNFYPTAYNVLMEDFEFVKLSKRYQESVWKPYFHTLANHWKPFEQHNISWSPTNLICPILV